MFTHLLGGLRISRRHFRDRLIDFRQALRRE
jgi:hypothetical protein